MDQRRFVVLGAGISGLAAAQALRHAGLHSEVVEACPSVGGLTRTTRVGDFCFDYTGHLLHLSRYGSPAGVPFAGLRDEDWERVDRKSFCYLGNRLVTAPVQYHLSELPENLRERCVRSYDERPQLPEDGSASFRDFVVSGFGQALSDVFLIPQNEKTMATPLDRLSSAAVKRFFPPPDEERVRAGMAPSAPAPAEYNSTFWYPKLGGIQCLVEGLAHDLDNVHLLQEVTEIDLRRKRLRTASGSEWTWDVLLSSMPLKTVCELTADGELMELARKLTHSSTISINLGVRGPLPEVLRGVHWIYIPDRDIPFYRVGVYSNMSGGMCPPHSAALYVEVGVPGEALDSVDVAGDLQPRVLAALENLGWVNTKDIVCSVVHVIRSAYVHHTPERDSATSAINDRLRTAGIFPIGRYGQWDYTSMEDSIASAIHTVNEVVL